MRGVKRGTYINTAWQSFGWKDEVEFEFPFPCRQPALAAKYLFVLEERGLPVAVVPEVLVSIVGYVSRIDGGQLGGGPGVFEDADEAMQGDRQMGDANGFDDGQDDGAGDMVAGRVLAVRLVGSDMEVGEVAGSRVKGQAPAREERRGL